jgi:hypothetical protein
MGGLSPAAVARLDSLLSRLGRYASKERRVHAGVAFDPMEGIGGVPDAANVDYRGFMAYMRPKSFLDLNPPRDLAERPVDHIREAIQAGEPLGTPMLYVERTPDGGWAVKGHEGRGRMSVLSEMAPQSLFPVAVHPYGSVRARDLSPEDVLGWIRPDSRGGVMPTRPRVSFLNRQPHARWGESDAEYIGGLMPDLESLVRELPPR